MDHCDIWKYLHYNHRKATKCHQRKCAMHRTLGIYINLFFFSLMLCGFSVFPSLPPLTQIHRSQPRSEPPTLGQTFLPYLTRALKERKTPTFIATKRVFFTRRAGQDRVECQKVTSYANKNLISFLLIAPDPPLWRDDHQVFRGFPVVCRQGCDVPDETKPM